MNGGLGAGSGLDIPPEVTTGVTEALGETRVEGTFVQVEAIGGGCIHPAARIHTASGSTVFLKWGTTPGRGGFGVEAAGLAAISAAGGPRVPEVLAFESGGPGLRGWILLEFIESGLPTPRTPRLLGSGLARLHCPLDESRPGWEEDGFIGSLPQSNWADQAAWPEFWQKKRLRPQWALAERYFDDEMRMAWDRLMERMEPALSVWEADGLSLLHGDLWSGNVLTDSEGGPVLVDPAVYRGHREVDLAMMELFGGFDSGVIEQYQLEVPLAKGYQESRRDLYQLYPLLVHVNLFGAGYVAGVRDRVQRLLKRLT